MVRSEDVTPWFVTPEDKYIGILDDVFASADPNDKVALQVFTYAFPLIVMEFSKRIAINVPEPNDLGQAPLNQFGHTRSFPTPGTGLLVRPSFDTLYSSAFIDVSTEPIILSAPSSDRYFMLHILDMWTETVAAPGSRTTGNQFQEFAIHAIGWKGKLPDGVIPIEATTNTLWILGRYQTNTIADYEHVRSLQDALKLIPLSKYGSDYVPPKNETNPEWEYESHANQLSFSLDPKSFFTLFTNLLNQYSTHIKYDSHMVKLMKSIGIEKGSPFNSDAFPKVENLLSKMFSALKEFNKERDFFVTTAERWTYPTLSGVYGAAYPQRAIISIFGLGATLLEDAKYYNSELNEDGVKYNGVSDQYVIDFPVEKLPPVHAFWSLSVYNSDGYHCENVLNRYAVGDRDFPKGIDIRVIISHTEIKESDGVYWLPAPAEDFNLLLRLFWPKNEVNSNQWTPPPVFKFNPNKI